MPMDPQLAKIYQTNQDTDDVEKLAAAKLAEDLAGEEAVDAEDLTDEQAEELAKQLLAEEASGEKVEEPGEAEEEQEAAGDEEETEEVEEPAEEGQEKLSAAEQEAQEKLAEADYLGRVMAHAYVQELRGIEKEAGAGGKVMGAVKRYGELMAGGKKFGSGGRPGNTRNLAKGSWGHGERKASTLARGATATTVVAGGAGAKKAFGKKNEKGKKKAAAAEAQEPTALDVLAQRRALEILAENGIDPNAEVAEAPEQGQEKLSADEKQMAQLAQAVEGRAVQMLTEAGYIKAEAEGEEAEEQDESEKE